MILMGKRQRGANSLARKLFPAPAGLSQTTLYGGSWKSHTDKDWAGSSPESLRVTAPENGSSPTMAACGAVPLTSELCSYLLASVQLSVANMQRLRPRLTELCVTVIEEQE